jgi:hypothetical protein
MMEMKYSIFNPQPKDGEYRDPKYLSWVLKYPCLIPGCGVKNDLQSDGLITYHHFKGLKGGGMSIKPPDYHVVPLCDEHHNLWHRMGESYFNLDREYILTKMLEYIMHYTINLKSNGGKS